MVLIRTTTVKRPPPNHHHVDYLVEGSFTSSSDVGPRSARMTGKRMRPWKRPNETVSRNTWKRIIIVMATRQMVGAMMTTGKW